jgi:hypothetical protein
LAVIVVALISSATIDFISAFAALSIPSTSITLAEMVPVVMRPPSIVVVPLLPRSEAKTTFPVNSIF